MAGWGSNNRANVEDRVLVKNELCYCELKENFQHVESNISLAVLRKKKKKLFLVHKVMSHLVWIHLLITGVKPNLFNFY